MTFFFGCDYYPEQWAQWLDEGEARWETDAGMMAAAGFNTVRLAEFAWGLLEPEPEQFDFAWLDRAIAVLHRHGLSIVLGTPTAAPPPWLLHAHPDLTQVDENGRRQGPGTRREACANHPAYQARSRLIVERMASHYAGHPALIGWQTDNEFGCHDTGRCFCPHCARAFQTWLRQRYGDLAALNKAWGGTFWGETYHAWEHIPAPLRSTAERNPGHLLDYFRFSSDSWVAYHRAQIDILRRACPGQFITHNLMGFAPQINYYDLSQGLDFVSWDNYHYHGATPAAIAAAHDHMRGVLRRHFWVIEQQVGQVNWSVYNPATPPGFTRLKTYQSIAHGADGMIYFRWRQALAGSEQYHSGLLDHAGQITPSYAEAAQIGREMQTLAPLLAGAEPQAQAAILLDYDSRWALEIQPHNQHLRGNVAEDHELHLPALQMDSFNPQDGPPYMTGRNWLAWPFLAPYVALWEKNIGVDIIAPAADLSRYPLVCAPFLHLLRPEIIATLQSYVHGGGTLVLGPRAGYKDAHNRLFATPQPGPLADLAGVHVRFFDSLEPRRANHLHWRSIPTTHDAIINLWAEVLQPRDAAVLASYGADWYAGQPAITHARRGKGQVIYVGCMGGPALYHILFDWLLPPIGVAAPLAPVAGVEVAVRQATDGRRLIFLLNHTAESRTLSLPQPGTDLLSGQRHERLLHLHAGQVAVFELRDG
ncbi:MAG: beta-galactosidase [Caldilineales bacterium]|nr:beta-galactosidase [Caldilineales bacterium]